MAAGAEGVLPCVAVATAASSGKPEDAADPGLNVGVSLRGSGVISVNDSPVILS